MDSSSCELCHESTLGRGGRLYYGTIRAVNHLVENLESDWTNNFSFTLYYYLSFHSLGLIKTKIWAWVKLNMNRGWALVKLNMNRGDSGVDIVFLSMPPWVLPWDWAWRRLLCCGMCGVSKWRCLCWLVGYTKKYYVGLLLYPLTMCTFVPYSKQIWTVPLFPIYYPGGLASPIAAEGFFASNSDDSASPVFLKCPSGNDGCVGTLWFLYLNLDDSLFCNISLTLWNPILLFIIIGYLSILAYLKWHFRFVKLRRWIWGGPVLGVLNRMVQNRTKLPRVLWSFFACFAHDGMKRAYLDSHF